MKKYSDFYDASNVLKVLCRDSAEDVTIVGIPTWISEPYFNADCVPGEQGYYVVNKEKELEPWKTLAEKLKYFVNMCDDGIKRNIIKETEIESDISSGEKDLLPRLFHKQAKRGRLNIPDIDIIHEFIEPIFWFIYDSDFSKLPWQPEGAEKDAVYRLVTGKAFGSGEFDKNTIELLKVGAIRKVPGYMVPITYIVHGDAKYYGKPYRVYSNGRIRNCYAFAPMNTEEVIELNNDNINAFIEEMVKYKIELPVNIVLEKDAETSLRYMRERYHTKLTVKKLAALSGVSPRTIEDYEQKRRPIWKASADIVMRLAKAMQLQPEDILDYWEE